MNLLAIDTSTETASVALFAEEKLYCEEQRNQKTHAQFLLPMIDKLLRNASFQLNRLDAIVFGCGPGSFTGLRIACSIAKGLAYANDLPLIPVSTLGTIAWSVRQQQQNSSQSSAVLAVLDARMQELYWAYFSENQWTAEEHVSSVHELYLPNSRSVILAGTGIDLYWDKLHSDVKSKVSNLLNVIPSAAAMIQFAQFHGQNFVSAALAKPVYVRNKVTY